VRPLSRALRREARLVFSSLEVPNFKDRALECLVVCVFLKTRMDISMMSAESDEEKDRLLEAVRPLVLLLTLCLRSECCSYVLSLRRDYSTRVVSSTGRVVSRNSRYPERKLPESDVDRSTMLRRIKVFPLNLLCYSQYSILSDIVRG